MNTRPVSEERGNSRRSNFILIYILQLDRTTTALEVVARRSDQAPSVSVPSLLQVALPCPCPAPAPPCLTANPSSPEPPKSPNGACNSIEKVSLTEGGNQKYVRGALSVFLFQFDFLFHISFFFFPFHTTFRGCPRYSKRFLLSLSLTLTSVDPCLSTLTLTPAPHTRPPIQPRLTWLLKQEVFFFNLPHLKKKRTSPPAATIITKDQRRS